MRHIVTMIAVAAAIAVGTLTGCGREPAAASPPQVGELTYAEKTRLDQAQLRDVQRCMARQGFRYWVQAPLSAEENVAFQPRVVLNDVAWARKHGYGGLIKQKVLAAKEHDPNLGYRAGLSPAELRRYVTALGGGSQARILSVRVPSGGHIRTAIGGCQGEAERKLYGDVDTWFRVDKIVTNLNPLYVPKLVRDQRYVRALTAWSACMRKATGRSYGDPDAVQSDVARRTEGLTAAKAHSMEVRLAVAEATCARGSALPATIHQLAPLYSEPARRRYAREITAYNRMRFGALQRATNTLRRDN